MIRINLFKTGGDDTKLVINGAHIYSQDERTHYREPRNKNWYDLKHKRVMDAVMVLENALTDLID